MGVPVGAGHAAKAAGMWSPQSGCPDAQGQRAGLAEDDGGLLTEDHPGRHEPGLPPPDPPAWGLTQLPPLGPSTR